MPNSAVKKPGVPLKEGVNPVGSKGRWLDGVSDSVTSAMVSLIEGSRIGLRVREVGNARTDWPGEIGGGSEALASFSIITRASGKGGRENIRTYTEVGYYVENREGLSVAVWKFEN